MHRFKSSLFLLVVIVAASYAHTNTAEQLPVILLEDDFSTLRTGLLTSAVGAHTEYHYLSEAAPKGKWAVSTFKSYGSQRAWRLIE
ncbi:MAG: hypothetical protein ACE5NM_09020, partial [Sedimentisphaerales bacterium]